MRTRLDSTECKDFSMISAYKNLKHLNINYNYLRSIDFLTKFGHLQSLLAANTLADNINLSPLNCLEELKYLELGANNLALSDANLRLNLEYIGLFDVGLSDLSCIKELTNLKEINLWRNKISDVNQLQYFQKLERLNLRANKVENPLLLKNFHKLKSVVLAQNKIDINDLKILRKTMEVVF